MRTVKFSKTSREFTKREQLKYSDGNGSIKLDEVLQEYVDGGKDLIVKPTGYAILDIHNDEVKREDGKKDYNAFIFETDDGKMYTTGSKTFMDAFLNIWDTMDGEEYEIRIIRKDSTNYKGKYFLTCAIV